MSVLWHAVWQPQTVRAKSLIMENSVTFFSIDKLYFHIFLFHAFHLSPSREWITLKSLVLCNDTSVNWCWQHNWSITIISNSIFYFTYIVMEMQTVPRRLQMLMAFEFFLVISESPPRFPHSYQLSVCLICFCFTLAVQRCWHL